MAIKHLFILFAVTLSACSSLPFSQPNQQGTVTAEGSITTEQPSVKTTPPVTKPAAQMQAKKPADDYWQQLRSEFILPELDSKWVRYYEKQYSKYPKGLQTIFMNGEWYLPYILDELKRQGLPGELALIPAVESEYKTTATSRTHAAGLWQFIRSTGRLYKLDQTADYDGRRDPVLATGAALQFFTELGERFDENWFHAIAGYNAGGLTIKRAITRNRKDGISTEYAALKLRKETTRYVPKLIALRNIIRDPKRFGITLPRINLQNQMVTVNTRTQTDLKILATKLKLNHTLLRTLNAGYLHGTTPVNGPYLINLPTRSDPIALQAKVEAIPKSQLMLWQTYTVQTGDVLGRIAARYGLSTANLKRINTIRGSRISPGDRLRLPANARLSAATSKPKSQQSVAANTPLTHRVRAGDTLWQLAKQYGVRVAQIKSWNQISAATVLKLGQPLLIHPKRI